MLRVLSARSAKRCIRGSARRRASSMSILTCTSHLLGVRICPQTLPSDFQNKFIGTNYALHSVS